LVILSLKIFGILSLKFGYSQPEIWLFLAENNLSQPHNTTYHLLKITSPNHTTQPTNPQYLLSFIFYTYT